MTTVKPQESTDKSTRWVIGSIFAILMLLIILVGIAITGSSDATEKSSDVASQLSIHEARQNGTLESINSQLSTLRTYHSTLRGEMKEQRKLLDDLLRRSHVIHKPAD